MSVYFKEHSLSEIDHLVHAKNNLGTTLDQMKYLADELPKKTKKIAKHYFSWVTSLIQKTFVAYGASLGSSIYVDEILLPFGSDFRVVNPMLQTVGLTVQRKYMQIWHVVDNYLYDKVPYQLFHQNSRMHHISKIYSNAFLEEVIFRGLIQKMVLPLLSKPFPSGIRNILNHKATRITLTSILFSLGHEAYWHEKSGVSIQFIGGLIFGTAAEFDHSLLVPITAHFLYNFTQLSSSHEFYSLVLICLSVYAICKIIEIWYFSKEKQN